MVGYALLIGLVFLAITLLVLGEVLAVGVVLWGGLHLLRGRPSWYVMKMLKGGAIGAFAGLAVALVIILPAGGGLPDDRLDLLGHLVGSAFGWAAVAPARWYFTYRFETSGAPV